MIIELNKPFADYSPLELISGENCAYRQVFKALDCEGKEVFLTIYDKNKLPKCLFRETIKEFDIIYNMTNEVFPRHIATGATLYEDCLLEFLSTEYFDFITLREAVNAKLFMEEEDVNIVCELATALKELLYYTDGGGHFNINPDTVLLSKKKEGGYKVHITGMDHAAKACKGSPEFDTETLNNCFRAPESFLGRYSATSDVYSMGMLLAYILQGVYPYEIDESMTKSEILNIVKGNKPQINVPDELRSIISKALNKNAKERYKNIEEFGIALKQFAGDKSSTSTNDGKKLKIGDKPKGKRENDIQKDSQEPRINVTIAVKEGEGLQAVAGMDDLKKKLRRDFVDIVSNKELAKEYDILPPNMLLYGPPGTGKTYISQRLAEECGLGFCAVKPSDLASVWVHGSQVMLKQLFEKAAKVAAKNEKGCLLLIDEFDAIAPARSVDDNNHQAGEVAELLTQLNDCIEKNIYVIGTTNFLNRIDKAVIRKGRIDEVVFIGMPDAECRRQIFEMELNKRPHDENIDTELLSKLTDGYTSSDISYMVKESARNSFEASIHAKSKCAVKITQAMIEEVISKTKASVNPEEVRQYERMRDEYIRKNGDERKKRKYVSLLIVELIKKGGDYGQERCIREAC